MEIAFETRELRDICEKEVVAIETLGADGARALQRRLADLRAAGSIEELVVGRPASLDGTDAGRMSVRLTDSLQLVLSANHRRNPVTTDGDVNWPQVRRVKIQRIERFHV